MYFSSRRLTLENYRPTSLYFFLVSVLFTSPNDFPPVSLHRETKFLQSSFCFGRVSRCHGNAPDNHAAFQNSRLRIQFPPDATSLVFIGHPEIVRFDIYLWFFSQLVGFCYSVTAPLQAWSKKTGGAVPKEMLLVVLRGTLQIYKVIKNLKRTKTEDVQQDK